MTRIPDEEVILSVDFVKDAGRDILTDNGSLDLMLRILRSPSTLRIVAVASKDLRKIQLEEIVIGNDLADIIRTVTRPSFYHVIASAFEVDPRRIGFHLRTNFVRMIEQLRHQEQVGQKTASVISREERDRRRAWGESEVATTPLRVKEQSSVA